MKPTKFTTSCLSGEAVKIVFDKSSDIIQIHTARDFANKKLQRRTCIILFPEIKGAGKIKSNFKEKLLLLFFEHRLYVMSASKKMLYAIISHNANRMASK